MKIDDLYRNCFCNTRGEAEIVRLADYTAHVRHAATVVHPMIVFMVRGSAHVFIEGTEAECDLAQGHFIFVPSGAALAIDFVANSTLLEVRITGEMPAECPVFKIDRQAASPADFRDTSGIHVLRANRRILNLISELQITLDDGFVCRHFLEGETTRLLFLLNAYYSESDRIRFFSRVLTPDIRFSEFVRMNHSRFRTIGAMAESLCMTQQAFSNRFRRVFGTTPHRWISAERSRRIYRDLCRSELSFKAIALKYGFSVSSNFYRFCKSHFGESPGRIRRSLHRDFV